MRGQSKYLWTAVLVVLFVFALPGQACAYIGPGAGFAFAGSFLAIFAAVLSAIGAATEAGKGLARHVVTGACALKPEGR